MGTAHVIHIILLQVAHRKNWFLPPIIYTNATLALDDDDDDEGEREFHCCRMIKLV